ncbi:NlpC/P60 family protein [Pontibacillus salicampi]|uniref:NlpC/P60 family protein n=1 Tax=Pontibacillus salicampi TaxID=1449801 RepID=A0ABV6LLR2_9BACI
MRNIISSITLAVFITLGSFSLPVTTMAAEPASAAAPASEGVEEKADQLIATAKDLIGQATYSTSEYKKTAPYQFSCATFLNFIFAKHDVHLGTYNEDYMMQQGMEVSKQELQKGDLLFFDGNDNGKPDHVGMYIGNQQMIHMADAQHDIMISDINGKSYYTDHYMSARRVLPALMDESPVSTADQVVNNAYDSLDTETAENVKFIKEIYSKEQISVNASSVNSLMNSGSSVSKQELQKGDLVFFGASSTSNTPSIAAIYGGEHRMIVPTSNGVKSRVLFVPWYEDRYLGATRLLSKDKKVQSISTKKDKRIAQTAADLVGAGSYGYDYAPSSLTFTPAGFTHYVYAENGIELSSTMAANQATEGNVISKDNLQAGDLLYFSLDGEGKDIRHAAIYVGDNQMVHMTKEGIVKESITTPWAQANFATARRHL